MATFAAQYTGAGRPLRVGPAVWQGLYFSVIAGLGMLLLIPLAGPIFRAIDHAPTIQALEVQFFRCLCWLAVPGLLTATVSAFFSGRGQSTVVIGINAVGLVVTATLDYLPDLRPPRVPRVGADRGRRRDRGRRPGRRQCSGSA